MKSLKYLFILLVVLSGTSVYAGVPVPALLDTEPPQPRANQQFDVVYALDSCGDTFAPDLPQNRVIDVSGSRIAITARYASDICFPGQSYSPEYRWRIGQVPPGTYQLELRGYNEQNGPEISFQIALGEVTVVPAPAASGPNIVPAAGTQGLLVLCFLTVAMGVWVLKRR